MTRALVLGGGGPVGIGWEAGLLVGLAGAGLDVRQADSVIGTSAGSVVGFTLASGGDLREAPTLVGAAGKRESADSDLEQLIATLAEAASDAGEAEAARARLGRVALEAPTMSEELWLAMFGNFAGANWPDAFACTAVATDDGRFQVWDRSSGVDVQHAVASSCAVPGIFPPVTINGRRWMDGGVRDILNADSAAGHDVVLAVSCTLLDIPEEFAMPGLDAVMAATRSQLDRLRSDGSKVETIVPAAEMLEISGWGLNLMDFTRAASAYEAGVRQGEAEAARLDGFWSD
ncbi:MAG TPA: patatin-like phospholipase family protein [Acidimicrobiales bacterium]|nr:patatin-like phospholipase family protein [Acidimicrobiales bacterium]